MATVFVLVASQPPNLHEDVHPRNHHLLRLSELREVGREVARVHLVGRGVEEGFIHPALLSIRAPATIANAVLELHLKPPLIASLAGLHDDAVEGFVELLDARPIRIIERGASEGGTVNWCLKGRIPNVEIISGWRWRPAGIEIHLNAVLAGGGLNR